MLLLDVVLQPGDAPGDVVKALHGVTKLPVTLHGLPSRGLAFWRTPRPSGPVTVRVALSTWSTLTAVRKTFDDVAGAIAVRARSVGYDLTECAVWSEDGERVPVNAPTCPAMPRVTGGLVPCPAFLHLSGRCNCAIGSVEARLQHAGRARRLQLRW